MDGKDGIYCTQDSISENAYSAYVATPQGAEVAGNDYDWLIYGQNKQLMTTVEIERSYE